MQTNIAIIFHALQTMHELHRVSFLRPIRQLKVDLSTCCGLIGSLPYPSNIFAYSHNKNIFFHSLKKYPKIIRLSYVFNRLNCEHNCLGSLKTLHKTNKAWSIISRTWNKHSSWTSCGNVFQKSIPYKLEASFCFVQVLGLFGWIQSIFFSCVEDFPFMKG